MKIVIQRKNKNIIKATIMGFLDNLYNSIRNFLKLSTFAIVTSTIYFPMNAMAYGVYQ